MTAGRRLVAVLAADIAGRSLCPHSTRSIVDGVASAFQLREIHERIRERFAVRIPYAPPRIKLVILLHIFDLAGETLRDISEAWQLAAKRWRGREPTGPVSPRLKSESLCLAVWVVRPSLTARQAVRGDPLRALSTVGGAAAQSRAGDQRFTESAPFQSNHKALRCSDHSSGRRVSAISLRAVSPAGCRPFRIATTMSGARDSSTASASPHRARPCPPARRRPPKSSLGFRRYGVRGHGRGQEGGQGWRWQSILRPRHR